MSHSNETEAVIPELLPRAASGTCSNQERERSAYPHLQTSEVFLQFETALLWQFLARYQLTVRNIRTIFRHEMVTVEQTLAVKPIERLPLFLKKAGLDPG